MDRVGAFSLRNEEVAAPINQNLNERTIPLNGYEAVRISDISLHYDDLQFALHCLEELEKQSSEYGISQMAMWRGAATHFLRCFNTSAKFKLAPEVIFDNEEIKAYESYLYFRNRFGKYLDHDDQSHKMYKTTVRLIDDGVSLSVSDINSFAISDDSYTDKDFETLKKLIEITRSWVEIEREILLGTMKIRIEREPRERFAQRVLKEHNANGRSLL